MKEAASFYQISKWRYSPKKTAIWINQVNFFHEILKEREKEDVYNTHEKKE